MARALSAIEELKERFESDRIRRVPRGTPGAAIGVALAIAAVVAIYNYSARVKVIRDFPQPGMVKHHWSAWRFKHRRMKESSSHCWWSRTPIIQTNFGSSTASGAGRIQRCSSSGGASSITKFQSKSLTARLAMMNAFVFVEFSVGPEQTRETLIPAAPL